MSRQESLDRFQFEDSSASHEQIHVVFFEEVFESHLNPHSSLRIVPNTSRNGILVDALVKESSHVVVDREDVIHDVIGNLSKLGLIEVAYVDIDLDRHLRFLRCWISIVDA
jgi:hypothetical protein